MNKDQLNIVKKFQYQAAWNLTGSIAYEFLRIGHNALLAYIFTQKEFGLIGSIFSLLFLIVRLSDAGATNALLPFFGYLEQSRKHFSFFVIKNVLRSFFISIPLITGAVVMVAMNHSQNHSHAYYFSTLPKVLIIILPCIVITETLRTFLRQFLHLAGLSKEAVSIDLGLFILYISCTWPILYFYKSAQTISLVFASFFIDSLIGLLGFIFLSIRYYKKLQPNAITVDPKQDCKSITAVRGYAWLLRTSKEALSSNSLTPLFAATVGLAQAGLFYFAATLVTGLYAIMRSIIGYAGGAFFISARKNALPTNQAFKIISEKLSMIFAALIIFFAASYQDIKLLTQATAPSSKFMLFFILYFSIVVIEFTLFLYEQQFLFEMAIRKAFFWRLFELLLVYIITHKAILTQPATILTCIIFAKAVTLVALAIHGYRKWKIIPSFHLSINQFFVLCLISCTLVLLVKVALYGVGAKFSIF